MPAARRVNGNPDLVEALNQSVRKQEANNLISLAKYFRSANLTLRQADEYRRLHDDEQLYVMLMRFTSLVVETIPRHRLFAKGDPTYQLLRKDALGAMAELERLKVDLRLKGEMAALEANPFTPRKAEGATRLAAGNLPELSSAWAAAAVAAPPPPPLPDVPQPEGFDLLAVAPGSLGNGSSAGVSSSFAPSAPPLPSLLPELGTSMRLPHASSATLSKHAVLPLGLGPRSSFGSSSSRQEQDQAAAAVHELQQQQQRRPAYPQLEPPPSSVEAALAGLDLSASSQPQQHQLPSPYDGGLALGPQEVEVVTAPAPTRPLQPGETCCTPAPGQQELQPPSLPASASSGGLQEVRKRQSLRDVHISVALMDEFMRYAMSNTRRGIETCGILAGRLSPDDALFTITTLIVPKQTGTTDTVEMLAEEEIFEAQDSRAVYPLGWIHTHPSQTCFLSSVDIHTHCGFQLMMDEAVAIVMAPRDPSKRVGIFRLTTPGGLGLVQRCPLRGFHAHPPTDTGQPIYELCGHVYLNPRAEFEVVDLR